MQNSTQSIKYQYFKSVFSISKFSVNLTLTLFFLIPTLIFSQTIRSPQRSDVSVYGIQGAWSLGNLILEKNLTIEPKKYLISGVDQWHYTEADKQVQFTSDVTFFGTMGAVGVLGLIHWEDGYVNTMAQNIWITANLTQSVKLLAQRQRPAFFGSNDDYRSFFSGHSSITATAATTALWYAYHVKNPNKWAKPLGWTSLGLSLTTGILRIISGKHYPSDVITGFAVGTGVALLNLSLKKL